METDPSATNIDSAVTWWKTVSEHYADYSHRLAFNMVVEWTDSMSKDASLINSFYDKVTPVVRATNPTRIMIFSPKRISNPEYLDSMTIPASAGNYVMAEWHFYAAGPSSDPTSPKYWDTGTDAQKKLITDKIKFATDWQTKTNIPTWVGAWMAGNYNKGNTTTMETQIGFASYMVHVLDSVQIPWCINTIDKYYDYTTNMWIDSMAALRDTIDGITATAHESIKLSSLLGGDTLTGGTPVAIIWGGTVTDPVVIELLNNDVVIDTLTTAGANGSFSWTPADSLKGESNLKIRISSGNLSDSSDSFFAVAADQVSLFKTSRVVGLNTVTGIRNGSVALSVARTGTYSITLYSLSGRLIGTKNLTLNEGSHSVDFGMVPHGVMVVQIDGILGRRSFKMCNR